MQQQLCLRAVQQCQPAPCKPRQQQQPSAHDSGPVEGLAGRQIYGIWTNNLICGHAHHSPTVSSLHRTEPTSESGVTGI
ncbi:hypothetical protein JOB18_003723 [Solea senegalensis]|uniref:Uncharacterized protein n=1 Tax=Solea senegalensis TaxID=28829 RepID=A0AAV6SUQ5_SOLSE|nr:hypothetical protein JOB18_003723 [Solea senegalensis]